MKIILALLLTILFTTQTYANSAPLPEGWQEVTLADIKNNPDFAARKTNPLSRLKARGDFDGNGYVDIARLLKNKNNQGAIFVTFFYKGKASKDVLVQDASFQTTEVETILRKNIDPKKFCDLSSNKHCQGIKPAGDVINVVLLTMGNTVWYWDNKTQKFDVFYSVGD